MQWWQNPKFVTIRKCSVSGTLSILIFKFHGISRMSPHFHDWIANKVMDHPTECDGKLKFWSNSSVILHIFESEMDSKNILCWLVDCHPILVYLIVQKGIVSDLCLGYCLHYRSFLLAFLVFSSLLRGSKRGRKYFDPFLNLAADQRWQCHQLSLFVHILR